MAGFVAFCILLPLLGTVLGSAAVFFLPGGISHRLHRALSGFAAGVMTAASIWSLLIPAMERSAELGAMAFLPASAGFWLGLLFLAGLDRVVPVRESLSGSRLTFAVTLHNFPEGMAVGAVCAGLLAGDPGLSSAGTVALSLGLAVQNIPEGAIISLPMTSAGSSRWSGFLAGALSGVVEPLGAGLTLWLAGLLIPTLPWMLSFAAGAMLFVVVEELIPALARQEGDHGGTACFALGFTLMMALDVALG